jgi:hypothetical protein
MPWAEDTSASLSMITVGLLSMSMKEHRSAQCNCPGGVAYQLAAASSAARSGQWFSATPVNSGLSFSSASRLRSISG